MTFTINKENVIPFDKITVHSCIEIRSNVMIIFVNQFQKYHSHDAWNLPVMKI